MAGYGTGSPISFQCSRCRMQNGRRRLFDLPKMGFADQVELTGRQRKGRPGPRMSAISREYKCSVCGHVGWSRHVDLEMVAKFREKP